MTRSRVDRKVVRDRLELASSCIADLRALPTSTLEEFVADRRNPAAADSLLRRAIEALFDTARHILAKEYGVGALEYREVARQAGARGLLSSKPRLDRFVTIAGFRNRLVHHYDVVTPEELFKIVTADLGDLELIRDDLTAAAARLSEPPRDAD